LQLVRRFRIPALFCALAVLFCELVSRPYAEMGVSDDGPYILMARHLAETGHIAYNGWATATLGWQLYLGAAFIKLFGCSFTSVRMSTLLVAVATAFVLQRTLVRAGIHERNAMLGTLAFVLSPLYLMLSVTYMSDIFGLFAVVICLYGCLRALQASTDRATLGWLCFAVATNAVFGTARQIAWLGILVMVPSALYVLSRRGAWRNAKEVLPAGGAVAAGALFIFACMQWFARQPYSIPEHLVGPGEDGLYALSGFFHASLDAPFLLLPVVVLFLPALAENLRRSLLVCAVASVASALILTILHLTHSQARPVLEPTLGDWVTKYGGFGATVLWGPPPVFLGLGARVVVTIASLGGLLGLAASLVSRRPALPEAGDPHPLPWRDLGMLLVPLAVAYSLLLIPRAGSKWGVFDRYLLELLVVALPCVVRYYQERIRWRLPVASVLVVCVTAIYGVVVVRNMYSFYRARVALAAEMRASGTPDTSVNNGWEYDLPVEIRHSGHVNDPRIVLPAHAYVPAPPLSDGSCGMYWRDETPDIRPLYGVSFDPKACYGEAPFAPVHYSRWPYRNPGTLYVVRYLPPAR
jgi:hypothetical protein